MFDNKTKQHTFERPLIATPELDQSHQQATQDRLRSVTQKLNQYQCDAILLYDPVNIRYATDTSNMQVWTMHNMERYAIVFADGYVVLWDFFECEHLSDGNRQVDEIRTATSWSYFSAGGRVAEKATAWADEIAELVKKRTGKTAKIAVDKNISDPAQLLQERGIEVIDGEELIAVARMIKSPAEIDLMRYTIEVAEVGMQRMYDELKPGMTENELWAYLHFENIKHGGEWIETRILASGQRTNPWMQESSSRVMQEGEIISFDTDLIGPFGYCADISRAWTVGHTEPTAEQKTLYSHAYEQIQYNQSILKSGMTYKEFAEKAWEIPDKYYANRYCVMSHGVGMADETPAILHAGDDWQRAGYDGVFEENMVMCIESYIGERDGKQGIKLEEQVLISSDGVEALSCFPYELT